MSVENDNWEFTSLSQAYHYLKLARYNPNTPDINREAALKYVDDQIKTCLSLSNDDKKYLRNRLFILAPEVVRE